jgi:hypothetical protein
MLRRLLGVTIRSNPFKSLVRMSETQDSTPAALHGSEVAAETPQHPTSPKPEEPFASAAASEPASTSQVIPEKPNGKRARIESKKGWNAYGDHVKKSKKDGQESREGNKEKQEGAEGSGRLPKKKVALLIG